MPSGGACRFPESGDGATGGDNVCSTATSPYNNNASRLLNFSTALQFNDSTLQQFNN
jgi:hypothetical protein